MTISMIFPATRSKRSGAGIRQFGLARLVRPVRTAVGRLLCEGRLRRTIVSLNEKEDFELVDLGIRRDQIEALVRGRRLQRKTLRAFDHGS